MSEPEQIEVRASEVMALISDMTKVVAKAFSISRTEATRRIKAGSIEIIETVNGIPDYSKIAGLKEPLMVYSKEIVTYVRWSREWRKLRFES